MWVIVIFSMHSFMGYRQMVYRELYMVSSGARNIISSLKEVLAKKKDHVLWARLTAFVTFADFLFKQRKWENLLVFFFYKDLNEKL